MLAPNVLLRMRDVESEQNTLVTDLEYQRVDSNFLVFAEDVERDRGRDYGYSYRLFGTYELSPAAYQKEIGERIKRLEELQEKRGGFGDGFRDLVSSTEDMLEQEKHEEYGISRHLIDSIKEASVIVAPRKYFDLLSEINPDVQLAELQDPRDGDFPSRVPSNQNENTPRVLVTRVLEDERKRPREPIIDSKTIDLLFKHQTDRSRGGLYDFGYDRSHVFRIDDFLQGSIKWQSHTNPIERSRIKVKVPERFSRGRGIFSSGEFKEAGTEEVPANFYGLGGAQHGYRYTGNRFLEDLRAEKEKTIQEMYEGLWIKPLNSLDEILERQAIYAQLIDDEDYQKSVSRLERSLNDMIEPYLHLSNMGKLISSSILRSRWGGRIDKDTFHKDFTTIAKTFSEAYGNLEQSIPSVDPNSREIQILLEPVKAVLESNQELKQAYGFIRKVLDSNPRNYQELHKMFESELRKSGAKKIPELEQYNQNRDATERSRERGGSFFDDYDSPLEESEEGDNKQEESKDKEKLVSLRGYKTPHLEKLLYSFHRQNPVTGCEDVMSYFDYLGSNLAAYNAMASFFKKQGWVKPTILPAEEGRIDIEKGWNPFTKHYGERDSKDFTLTKNDTRLNPSTRVEIIDGPNITGKTVDIRKTFFIVSSAMMGNYVPAESAEISYFDKIRFRLKSTGMYEESALVEELGYIGSALLNSEENMLLGFDETFTSTNNIEGEALTYGLIKKMSQMPKVRGVITSHYPTLPSAVQNDGVEGVAFRHFEFASRDKKLSFPHEKLEGPNTIGDYALPIAQLMALPEPIIEHAKQYLEEKK